MLNKHGDAMPESVKVKQAKESFKDYLSETIQGKTAIVLGIDKNIYLQGVVNIIQEVTKGLIPLFIGRSVCELANINQLLKAGKADYLIIFENKHNLTDDEPRGEQLVFDWHVKDDAVMVTSSYSLVGKIRHRGLQL